MSNVPSRYVRFLAFLFLCSAFVFAAPAPHIRVAVDATQAARKIFHVKMTVPASAGTMTFYYPEWIPGEHGPTGPVQDLTGLFFTANGKQLTWRRDLLDGWTFHVEVPQGVSSIDVAFDFASPAGHEGLYTGGPSATDKMAVLSWNTLVLYPSGWTSDQVMFEASVRLPQGWKYGTPLPVANASGAEVSFQPVSLTTLVDSPIITGEFLRVVPLASTPVVHEMDIAADSAAALDAPSDLIEHYKAMVTQAMKLFGAYHYGDYHFLYSLSDHVAHFGLEHHESNDSRVSERSMIDPELRLLAAGLLTHEYVHSWNGKYRRPADLATPDYQKPMQTDLLWVYEGLTSYLGDVLSARSGLRNQSEFLDSVAQIAADLDHRSGRVWRNLQDTADGVPAMQGAPHEWESWRRPLDYYDEDVLNWLWVDTIIRQQTQGKKSMDDFCHLFHGGTSGTPELKTYTFDDVVNALNQIAPYDWKGFWTERLQNHGPGAPLTGIERSGWKLVYDENRSEEVKAREATRETVNAEYSIGVELNEEGKLTDTVEGMPAAKAGIGPGMKVVAVNGKKFSAEVLRDALKAGKGGSQPLELLIENTDYFNTFKIDYHDGEKYPHLVRDESKPDVLSDIIKAR
jgi:predicted metalloprotease with PDZ domain